MSEEPVKYEYEVGLPKRYTTEYKWTLNGWSLLHDSTSDEDFTSTEFDLNGTHDCTCKIGFYPKNWERPLTIQLSDTQEIEAMKGYIRTGKISWQLDYRKPIQKILGHSVGPQDGEAENQAIIKSNRNDAVVILVRITIVKVSDYISVLNPTAMLPQTLNTSHLRQDVLANFKMMFDRKAFCDVTLVVRNEIINAHKVVLAAQSQVFQAMFLSGMKEQGENTIEVSNFDAEVFKEFLNYIYGEVIKLEEKVEEMIQIADYYNVSILKIRCENIMLKTLSETSVIRYVILADKINCDTLKTAALDMIRNSTTIMETALLEEDAATMTDLKEILSKNQPEA